MVEDQARLKNLPQHKASSFNSSIITIVGIRYIFLLF